MVSFRHAFADYANVVKSFIGSNYLGVSFAFMQGGLVLSVVILFIVVILTEHCCNLIVVCKKHVLKKIFSATIEDDGSTHEMYDAEAKLLINKKMQLGDVGQHAFGKVGRVLVTLALFITQFGFCVNYFIFVGNTLKEIFPMHNVTVMLNTTKDTDTNSTAPDLEENLIPINTWHLVSSAPSLYWLVFAPFLIFTIFSLMRSVRRLGFVSIIANISILIGCIVIFIYLIKGFSVHPGVKLARWSTCPITIALLVSSFEGIGTILPIQGSMVGNQHNFRRYLIGGISSVAVLLLTFGSLGYLRYGTGTGQLLVANIPKSTFSAVVDGTLILGVIFTFPLQQFPVLNIVEVLLFTEGGLCYRQRSEEQSPLLDPNRQAVNGEEGRIEDSTESRPVEETTEEIRGMDSNHATRYKIHANNCVRSTIRFLMVVIQLGVALLMKDKYAYVSALTGALGSGFLAFIVPCACHLKLCWQQLPNYIRVKDISILIFGIVVSVWSFVTTVIEIIGAS